METLRPAAAGAAPATPAPARSSSRTRSPSPCTRFLQDQDCRDSLELPGKVCSARQNCCQGCVGRRVRPGSAEPVPVSVRGWHHLVPPTPGTALTRGISGSGFGASHRRGGEGGMRLTKEGSISGSSLSLGPGRATPGLCHPVSPSGQGGESTPSPAPGAARMPTRAAEADRAARYSLKQPLGCICVPCTRFPRAGGCGCDGVGSDRCQTVARPHSMAPGLDGLCGG